MPERYRPNHPTWPSPRDPRPAFAGVDPLTWAATPRPTIATATLHGKIGAGKSTFAAELLDTALRAGASRGWFVGAAELIERALAGDAAQATEVDVLVVDDLGGGHSGRSWESLFRVIKARHGAGLRTVCTTMLEVRELVEGRGDGRAVEAGADAIADRLIGEGYVWRLAGGSRRTP